MAIETKDVRNKTDGHVVLGEAQPHIVILPAEPTNLTQSVVVTAKFEKSIATEHSHRIDVRGLDQNLRVPVVIGEKANRMVGPFQEPA